MSDEIKIVSGVPVPPRRKPLKTYKYPFDKMEVGDMFFVPEGGKPLVNQTAVASKSLRRQFSTRTMYMRETKQGWKVCEPDAPDGRKGVGVWRVA